MIVQGDYQRGGTRLRTAARMVWLWRFIDRNPCCSVAEIAKAIAEQTEVPPCCERTVFRYVFALADLGLIDRIEGEHRQPYWETVESPQISGMIRKEAASKRRRKELEGRATALPVHDFPDDD